tara:strand:- start:2983 stop:3498 length:516 start_codon:yes stop_codon:yes gene_type:complete
LGKNNVIKIFEESPDDLTDYTQWLMAAAFTELDRPIDGIVHYNPATAVVIDRREAFQAELYTFPAGRDIPEHVHPNVESIEVQVSGSLLLYVEDQCIQGPFSLERAAKTFMNRGARIPAKSRHRVTVGPEGACFISVQKWTAGMPTSIGNDWASGHRYSETHEGMANEKTS